jgi:uncharacterized membrane protein YdjX (TVP38/TMEM64 family)
MKRLVGPVLVLLALLAASLAWRYTALAQLVRPDELVAHAEALRKSHAAVLLAPLVFVVLSMLLVPVTLLRAATVITFGPLLGPLYALVGGAAAALIGHELGKRAGAPALEHYAGTTVARFRARLEGRGVLAVAALRMVPLGPFTIVNAVCGAASIKRRDFMLGTTLVMIPTLLLMALAVSLFPTLQARIFPAG